MDTLYQLTISLFTSAALIFIFIGIPVLALGGLGYIVYRIMNRGGS